MHSGPKIFALRSLNLFILTLAVLLFGNCRNEKPKVDNTSVWLSPASGSSLNLGDTLELSVRPQGPSDSIVFYLDEVRLGASTDSSVLKVPTSSYSLGMKSLLARIYAGTEVKEEIGSSVLIKSSLVPKRLSYSVHRTFAHDTDSYTQGLELHNGVLYESDGEYGTSSLRKVDPRSGKVLQVVPVDELSFAEGITIIGDKILMLTYQQNKMYEYKLSDLELIREIPAQYVREGWGLTNDGKVIYNTDGSNRIYILNKDTYMQEGFIEVYDHNGPVDSLNELEYVEGMIYANIYLSNRIVVIDPRTGQVKADVDMSQLYPNSVRPMKDEDMLVLNGIAWDKANQRFYVTGKKWDKMFEISIK